jgi:hypothetical protein
MHAKSLIFASALAIGMGAAQAQQDKTFSLTISPFHLAMPVVELTGEYALSQDFGIAGIAGFGQMTAENNLGEEKDIPVLELGGQLDYYAVGSFRHGMQVGAELLWIKISPPENEGVTVSANGIAVGPLLGYKWAARFGLTLMAQLGWEFLFAQAEAQDRNGQEIEGSAEGQTLLLNLNAGWSF